MKSIYEVKENLKKISKDFEVVKSGSSDLVTKKTKAFLKKLDSRVEELGLTYDQCREAAKLFKHGNFKEALIKIWGRSKVKINTTNADAGAVSQITYTVDGYGVFTEYFIRKGLSTYMHKIEATYDNNPTPSYPLATVLYVEEKSKGLDFEEQMERANRESFKFKPTVHIYNILFVNYDEYDLSTVLSKHHIKLNVKL